MKSVALLFEVCIAFETIIVELEKALAFGDGQATLAACSFDIKTHRSLEVFRIVLDVRKDFFDRIAFDDFHDLPLARVLQGDVDGVSVAKKVVKIAEDFLICPKKEDTEVVGFYASTFAGEILDLVEF